MSNTPVPLDENGNPLALVGVSTGEKINLELINPTLKFSNVDIGAWVSRYVEDTEEGRRQGLRDCTEELGKYMEAERAQLAEDYTP